MKWVLPLVRHLVLEEHMTSPLMQSKAIYNPHHCTFFLIFMKCIVRRGTSVSLREFINYLAVWEKAKKWIQFWRTKWTILKKMCVSSLNSGNKSWLFAMYCTKTLNICVCLFFFLPFFSFFSDFSDIPESWWWSDEQWKVSVVSFQLQYHKKIKTILSSISFFCPKLNMS